jgi:hypothetical protein
MKCKDTAALPSCDASCLCVCQGTAQGSSPAQAPGPRGLPGGPGQVPAAAKRTSQQRAERPRLLVHGADFVQQGAVEQAQLAPVCWRFQGEAASSVPDSLQQNHYSDSRQPVTPVKAQGAMSSSSTRCPDVLHAQRRLHELHRGEKLGPLANAPLP